MITWLWLHPLKISSQSIFNSKIWQTIILNFQSSKQKLPRVGSSKKKNNESQDDSEHALKRIPQQPWIFRAKLSLKNLPSSECQWACRPAVVKSIVNDVHHVIWASSLFMLDQLYPYSKQIISYNYQPEDKSLNVFLMIVLWLAGVKSASQGQRLKMSLFSQILQARMLSFLSCHVQRSLVWCPVNEI